MGILRLFVVEACGTRGDSAEIGGASPAKGVVMGRVAASRPVPLVARNFLRSRVSSDFGDAGRFSDIGGPPEGQGRWVKRIPAALYAGGNGEESQKCSRITSAGEEIRAAARKRPP